MVNIASIARCIAPSGVLRCGINLSNFLLVSNPTTCQGVAPSLATLLGQTLGVDVEMIPYANPKLVTEAAVRDEWDVALLGAEPQRAEVIAFTQPYVEIQASYLVRSTSAIKNVDDVDSLGGSVVVSRGSAYGLWLENNLVKAQLHLTDEPGLDLSRELYLSDDNFDALAGLRPWLLEQAETIDGARVLDGKFTSVMQSMGTPRHRADGGSTMFLERWVTEKKADGTIGGLIREFGVQGKLSVAD